MKGENDKSLRLEGKTRGTNLDDRVAGIEWPHKRSETLE